jgi:2,4-dienoyl-CoA reductase-like NADH-dependent reductase (Old Yellow Enzyme family)
MPDLLSPLSFSGLTLRNRIVMPPMWSGQANPDGQVNEKIIEYHRRRAAAGCGLIIVEHAFVHPRGRHTTTQIGAHHDRMTPMLARLAAAVKAEGARVCMQLAHAGSRSSRDALGGRKPVAPSAVQHPREPNGDLPESLTAEQMAEVVNAFGDAAVRAEGAGFDAVEIHSAHGFLLSQFLSPLTNRRNDEYGGSVGNRARLLLEVLGEVRRRLDDRRPVFVRLGADDEMPGGLTLEDSCATAARLATAGVSLIDVSGGLQGSAGDGKPGAYFLPYAQAIKKAVEVPVLVTGGIGTPKQADAIVREGSADLVGIGRAMLNDAEWARKAIEELGAVGRGGSIVAPPGKGRPRVARPWGGGGGAARPAAPPHDCHRAGGCCPSGCPRRSAAPIPSFSTRRVFMLYTSPEASTKYGFSHGW